MVFPCKRYQLYLLLLALSWIALGASFSAFSALDLFGTFLGRLWCFFFLFGFFFELLFFQVII